MEISLDALLGVQRELADRLAQGVSGLLLHMHPPQLPPLPHKLIPFDIEFPPVPFVGGGGGVDLPAAAVASLVEIGDRLGQAGSGLGASVGGAVQQLSRQLSLPFIGESSRRRRWDAVPPPPPAVDVGVPAERPAAAGGGRALERPAAAGGARALGRPAAAGGGHALERPAAAGGGRALGRPAAAGAGRALERPVGDRDSLEAAAAAAAAATGSAAATSGSGAGGEDESDDEDNKLGFVIGTLGRFLRPKGRLNVSATYSTRDRTVDASVIARGETWRLQSSRNNSGPPFLIQLGPLILLRDYTFLFPINLSKQHLIWFGCDHKNRVFSICPAIWSKHRRWMLISMMRLNPVSCSFMDVDFPYGQLTYVAGEGLTARGYVPLFGVLPQFHGKFPGESKLSFSFKSTRGTRFTPAFQWPDNSVSFGVSQPVAWKKSGLMVKPSIQVSVCPTFGGSNPGIRAEVIHSLKEELNVTYGLSCSSHPSAFTSLSLGRSKINGEVRGSGVVVTVEAPLDNVGSPSLSVQLNGGFEF